MTPIRRVLIIHDYQGVRGGAERVVQDLRGALRRRGIDARLLASSADAASNGTEAEYVFPGTVGPFRALPEVVNPGAVAALRRALASFRPDLVHLGMFLTQASPAILPLLRDRPTLWWTNEYRAICPKGTHLLPDGTPCRHDPGRVCVAQGCFTLRGIAPRLVQRSLFLRWRGAVDRTLAPSRAMADELIRHGIPVDGVVPHWVAVSPHRGVRGATPLLAYAGRLDPTKGVDVVIRAFARLRRERPDARLLVVGDGPLAVPLAALAEAEGVAGAVEFTGALTWDDTQRRLAPAWVQVVPSVWGEPFGLVTVEAQLRGTPVVVSDVGAQPELVADGVTGWLVPPRDEEAWADTLLRRIDADAAHLDAVAHAARESARARYTEAVILDRLLAEYESLLLKAPTT